MMKIKFSILLVAVLLISGCIGSFSTSVEAATTQFKEDFSSNLNQWQNTTNATITNGKLVITNNEIMRSTAGSTWTDIVLDVDVSFNVNGAAGIVFRSPDSNNGYLWQLYSGNLRVQKKVNGTLTSLKNDVITAIAAQNIFHVRIEAVGSTIKTYIDEMLVDVTIDQTFSSGNIGFREYGGETGTFDNVQVQAALAPLLTEDFSNGLGKWANTQNTSIVGSTALRVTNNEDLRSVDGAGWTDFTFDADVNIINAAAGIVFKGIDSNNCYMWQFSSNGNLNAHKKVNGSWTVIKSVACGIATDVPFHVTIDAFGATIKTFVNGSLVDITLDNTFSSGKVGCREIGSETADFDNIKVSARNPLLSDYFDSNLVLWNNTSNAAISGGQLTITNNESLSTALGTDWTNFTLDVDAKITNGAAGIVFRNQDANNCYMWQLVSGKLRPYKKVNGSLSLIKEVPCSIVINTSYHIQIEAIGSTIKTYLNGSLIDTTIDRTFGGGGVGFREATTAESAVFDNLEVKAKPLPFNTWPKIMPIGDSITYGESYWTSDSFITKGGYRTRLWQDLNANNKDVVFVGSVSSGPTSLPYKACEGHGGWKTDQLLTNINSWMDLYKPDIILLQIGTNDFYAGRTVQDTINSLSTLIDLICEKLPVGGKLYVATITPNKVANWNANANDYNAQMKRLIPSKVLQGKPVSLVDINSSITISDLSDDCHPNTTGYAKMGDFWYNSVFTGAPEGYTYCANENGSYALSGACDIAYGANGQFNYLYGKTGTITFNNTTFGRDPIPNVAKKGYYKKVTYPAIDKTGWTVNASSQVSSGGVVGNAKDGDAATRWSTGQPQANGQWFTIDMGSTKYITRILLNSVNGDYPRGYQIYVSNDGTNWGSAIASGAGTSDDLDLVFDDIYSCQTARYIKIVQTGSASNWWSINEVNVFGTLGGIDSSSYYKIVNRTSGKVLDNGGTSNRGAQIQQWADNAANNTNQQWKIVDLGNGYYKLICRTSNMVMDDPSGSTSNGTIIQQYDDNAVNNINQQWTVQDIRNGYYKIMCRASGKVLDNTNGSLSDGNLIQQYDDGAIINYNQQWQIIKVQ
ncbi:MAG TPA: RICIN domain-containing protein [Ruminiclostridium sp.]